jgi:hypothetical protein
VKKRCLSILDPDVTAIARSPDKEFTLPCHRDLNPTSDAVSWCVIEAGAKGG